MSPRALFVIEFQKGIQNLYQLPTVITKVNKRIQHYCSLNQPIIFVQHEATSLPFASEALNLRSELLATPTDFYIRKTHANSFYQTELKELLNSLNVTELEFCSVQAEFCVDTTIRMAHGLGYNCYMYPGTCTTTANDVMSAATIIAHHEAIWRDRFLTFLSE